MTDGFWGGVAEPVAGTAYNLAGLTAWLQADSPATRTLSAANTRWDSIADSRGTGATATQANDPDKPGYALLNGRGAMAFTGTAAGAPGLTNLYFGGDSATDSPDTFYRHFSNAGLTATVSVVVRTPAAWPTDTDFLPIIGSWWWDFEANVRLHALRNDGGTWKPAFLHTDASANTRWRHPAGAAGALAAGALCHLTWRCDAGVMDVSVDGTPLPMNEAAPLPNEDNAHPQRGGAIGGAQRTTGGVAALYGHRGEIGDILIYQGTALSAARLAEDAAVTRARYPA